MSVTVQPETPVTVRSAASSPAAAPANPIENVCAKRPTIGLACGSMLITRVSAVTSRESVMKPSPVARESPCVWTAPVTPVPAKDEPPPPPPVAEVDPPPP